MKEDLSTSLDKLKQRFDQAEVKQVLNDILDQITQNQMDDKFEEALASVTLAMQQQVTKDVEDGALSVKPPSDAASVNQGFSELNDKLEK